MRALMILVLSVGTLFSAASAKAELIEFFLDGNEGRGLLGGNVNPAPTDPGSGGIGPAGIIFNTETNILSLDLEWGSKNGYTDLSGDATALHLHGPTDNPWPRSYDQNQPNLIINLGNSLNFRPSATDGGLIDEFFISDQEFQWMRQGRLYIQVHTELNPMGELRGYLIIPEPNSQLLLLLGGFAIGCLVLARSRAARARPATVKARANSQ